MTRYDGLIIPRSYNDYIPKSDAATLLQALQNAGVMEEFIPKSDAATLLQALQNAGVMGEFIPKSDAATLLQALQQAGVMAGTPTKNGKSPITSGGIFALFGGNTALAFHNIPRAVPKDITAYYNDGTIYQRLAGTNGFSKHEDIFVGDYIRMSRPVSAYDRTGRYQATGSQYVTIAGISTLKRMGDEDALNFEHLVMVPGHGFFAQHFGRARMNPTDTTEGGYKASEMNTAVIGAVATAGNTGATATINEQLFAEFGSHLKTTREVITTGLNANGNNRFGSASGCASSWEWGSFQAILMSEVEVYGSIVWSSTGYDVGNANHQFPLFFFSGEAINSRNAYYWLKGMADSNNFCRMSDFGISYFDIASNAGCHVRPRFVIA